MKFMNRIERLSFRSLSEMVKDNGIAKIELTYTINTINTINEKVVCTLCLERNTDNPREQIIQFLDRINKLRNSYLK